MVSNGYLMTTRLCITTRLQNIGESSKATKLLFNVLKRYYDMIGMNFVLLVFSIEYRKRVK